MSPSQTDEKIVSNVSPVLIEPLLEFIELLLEFAEYRLCGLIKLEIRCVNDDRRGCLGGMGDVGSSGKLNSGCPLGETLTASIIGTILVLLFFFATVGNVGSEHVKQFCIPVNKYLITCVMFVY
jgi:hypothetical protein